MLASLVLLEQREVDVAACTLAAKGVGLLARLILVQHAHALCVRQPILFIFSVSDRSLISIFTKLVNYFGKVRLSEAHVVVVASGGGCDLVLDFSDGLVSEMAHSVLSIAAHQITGQLVLIHH